MSWPQNELDNVLKRIRTGTATDADAEFIYSVIMGLKKRLAESEEYISILEEIIEYTSNGADNPDKARH